MNLKELIISLFFVVLMFPMNAQNNEFGNWTAVKVEKDLGKLEVEAGTQLRMTDHFSQMKRLSFEIEPSYKIIKSVKIGAGYKYMYFYDEKFDDFQPRQQYSFFISGQQKLGDFKISLREKFQRTIKDERDRIIETGKYDNYKINPIIEWRNRIDLEYNIPKCKITPDISLETFRQLNNPDGNIFTNVRYKLSFDYKLAKHHKIEIFGLIENEINVDNPIKTFVSGLEYKFSF